MDNHAYMKGLIVAVLLATACSCTPKIVERIVYQHDTTQVVRIDSVCQYQRDSVFIREKGDTVFKYVEHIRYRDRYRIDTLIQVRERHDTTIVERKVEKPLSWVQKSKLEAFWWLLGALAAALVWIFRKPLVVLLKMLFKI